MVTAAGVVAAVLLGLLCVFQIALAFGAPLGHYAWGGQHRVLPRTLRIGSGVAVLVYLALAVVALGSAGLITWSPPGALVWAVFALLSVGIVMNAISRSRPERLVMTPLVTVLAACFLVLALG